MRSFIFISLAFISLVAEGQDILKNWAKNYELLEKRCQQVSSQNLFESEQDKNDSILSFIAHSQYFLLKKSINTLVKSAKHIGTGRDEFSNIITPLIENQCSENLMLISKKNLRDIMVERFDRLSPESLYSKEDFIESIKIFSDICNWHGDGHEKSMLTYYLRDFLIASSSINDYLQSNVKALCQNGECRLMGKDNFNLSHKMPKNKYSLKDQVEATWCYDIRSIDHSIENLDDKYTKKRLKQKENELKRLRIYVYSVVAETPAPLAVSDWQNHAPYFFSSLINNEKKWSRDLLGELARKVEMEEGLSVRYETLSSLKNIEDLKVNLDIVASEFDKLVHNVDKLTFSVEYKVKKTFLLKTFEDLERIYINGYQQRKSLLEVLKKSIAQKLGPELFDKKVFPLKSLKKVRTLGVKVSEALLENLRKNPHLKSGLSKKGDPELFIPVNFSFGWDALQKIAAQRNLDKK